MHDLNVEICKSEGVEKFEDLGLGSLLRHPLVQSYFSISRDATEICQITTENLVSHLSTFIYRYRYNETVPVEEFLDSLVKRYAVAGREHLGVRVQSFGYIIQVFPVLNVYLDNFACTIGLNICDSQVC